MERVMKYPRALRPGDKIAIVTPATTVRPDYIDGACRWLERQGFVPAVYPHAKGPADGSFAASFTDRLADLSEAFADPQVRAILCARGGYGCVHLLEDLEPVVAASDGKWLIGFSDITALHALMQRHATASLHSPMAKHLTILDDEHPAKQNLLTFLTSQDPVTYRFSSDQGNISGHAKGRLLGGNLALLHGLAATPYDMPARATDEDVILFIEDVSEAIYAVERMLYRLHLSGILNRVKGLIIGQFTDYKPDKNYPDMYAMVRHFLTTTGHTDIPVAFNAPIGHVDGNLPVLVGAWADLEVSEDSATLKMSKL